MDDHPVQEYRGESWTPQDKKLRKPEKKYIRACGGGREKKDPESSRSKERTRHLFYMHRHTTHASYITRVRVSFLCFLLRAIIIIIDPRRYRKFPLD